MLELSTLLDEGLLVKPLVDVGALGGQVAVVEALALDDPPGVLVDGGVLHFVIDKLQLGLYGLLPLLVGVGTRVQLAFRSAFISVVALVEDTTDEP